MFTQRRILPPVDCCRFLLVVLTNRLGCKILLFVSWCGPPLCHEELRQAAQASQKVTALSVHNLNCTIWGAGEVEYLGSMCGIVKTCMDCIKLEGRGDSLEPALSAAPPWVIPHGNPLVDQDVAIRTDPALWEYHRN